MGRDENNPKMIHKAGVGVASVEGLKEAVARLGAENVELTWADFLRARGAKDHVSGHIIN